MGILDKLIIFFKELIFFVCFGGQLILIIPIGEYIFTHKEIGWLILCFVACEYGLYIIKEESLFKFIFSSYFEKK